MQYFRNNIEIFIELFFIKSIIQTKLKKLKWLSLSRSQGNY